MLTRITHAVIFIFRVETSGSIWWWTVRPLSSLCMDNCGILSSLLRFSYGFTCSRLIISVRLRWFLLLTEAVAGHSYFTSGFEGAYQDKAKLETCEDGGGSGVSHQNNQSYGGVMIVCCREHGSRS